MPTIADRGFFPEQSFVVPRDNVRCADADRNNTTGAHVVFHRARGRDVLDHPLVSAFRFGAATTGRTRDVEGRHLVTLRTVAATH